MKEFLCISNPTRVTLIKRDDERFRIVINWLIIIKLYEIIPIRTMNNDKLKLTQIEENYQNIVSNTYRIIQYNHK